MSEHPESDHMLLEIARTGGPLEQQRIAQLPEVHDDVLQELVSSTDQTVLLLMTYRTDLPSRLVRQLEDQERVRLAAGTGFGLDQTIGNMEQASTEFRLLMPLEFLHDDRLEETLEALNLNAPTREQIRRERDDGSLTPLGEVVSRLSRRD